MQKPSPAHTLRRLFALASVLIGVLLLIGRAHDSQAADPPARKVLHARHLERGAWIGWIDSRFQRTSVKVPQSKPEIEAFAAERDLDVVWHLDQPESVESADETPEEVPPEAAPAPPDRIVAAAHGSGPPAGSPPASPPAPGTVVSVAEQTTRLERIIAADTRQLETLRSELADPDGEYPMAEHQFKAAEKDLALWLAEVGALQKSGPAEELKDAEEALAASRMKHGLARERFDLAIQTRKTLQEQTAALEAKIAQDAMALGKLTGAVPATPPAPAESPDPATPAAPAVSAPGGPAAPANANPPATTAPVTPPPAPPAVPAAPEGVPDAAAPPEAKSAEVQEAQQRADLKKEEARVAELEAQSVTDRLKALDKMIELEQKLFLATRKKADIALQQQQAIQDEYQQKCDSGADRIELQALSRKVDDAQHLFIKARTEVAERTDRLSALQADRTALQAEELAALKAAEDKRGEAVDAEEEVSTLENPFSLHNILQWLLDHGVKIALILGGILLLRWLLRLTTRRLVDVLISSGARGTLEEREDRAKTLVGVFQNAGSMVIIVGGGLMICEEIGIAVAPLMGGAAVVGLAFAFGAQNLIRDYFYGFVILLENQYKINDILKIGDVAGQVERITLRMTVLRDLEGRVHFIPNGKIDSVTNMTHGWSRAVFDIGVAYKEDADRVMSVLMELARELRRDPPFATMILEDPEMLGVDSFGDSAYVLKFVVKTRPLKQWAVKRELLRRILRRFEELGIEIPFPHRTIYHHTARDADDNNDGEILSRRVA